MALSRAARCVRDSLRSLGDTTGSHSYMLTEEMNQSQLQTKVSDICSPNRNKIKKKSAVISAPTAPSNAAAGPQGVSLKMRRKRCVFAAAEFFPVTNDRLSGHWYCRTIRVSGSKING